jgi:hypothetical protein
LGIGMAVSSRLTSIPSSLSNSIGDNCFGQEAERLPSGLNATEQLVCTMEQSFSVSRNLPKLLGHWFWEAPLFMLRPAWKRALSRRPIPVWFANWDISQEAVPQQADAM